MQDKDIRRLFQKAEIQVCPEQKRILKMYEHLQNEIDKNEYKNKKQRKRIEILLRDILWQQFRLIDKTYVIVYIMAAFAGFALMIFLQYAGTGKNDAIMVSMIISGCLSTLSGGLTSYILEKWQSWEQPVILIPECVRQQGW